MMRPVHSRDLLRVVAFLFGLPLVALIGAVWLLQALEVTAYPLLSLLILAGGGCTVVMLAKVNGDTLLRALQPQQPAATK